MYIRVCKEVPMQVAIDNDIYQEAQTYAKRQGMDLDVAIETFLVHFIDKNKSRQKENVPDVVLSLLGAGEGSADDLNGREAYYRYLEEKHK